MSKRIVVIAVFVLMGSMAAQTCSTAAPTSKEWKPLSTAAKDGTIVEVMNTYGIGPWYGIFQWEDGRWKSSNRGDQLIEESCNYWRPYKGDPKKYIDPTGGAQNTNKYWCPFMHAKYNAKKDACYY